MAGWYSLGTVTVTNGSKVVTGVGTDFINNVSARDAFALTGGNPNEIESIQSTTQMTLARPWLGATAGGQAYVVIPTVGIYVDLALRALNMLTPFQAVIDGIGQGFIPSGTLAAPGLRFSVDQDTGIRRTGENSFALVAGGVDRLTVNADGRITVPFGLAGNIGFGTTSAQAQVHIKSSGEALRLEGTGSRGGGNLYFAFYDANGRKGYIGYGLTSNDNFYINNDAVAPIIFQIAAVEQARIDPAGNFMVGASSATAHLFAKSVAEGNAIFQIVASATGTRVAQFNGTAQEGFNGARAALWLGKDSTTGRSGGFAGTVNASGADYAEYMLKAAGCGLIAKGDVCGVDLDGRLTKTWADAVSYVVKSTDPSLVGGDVWARHLGPKPDPIDPEPLAPGDAPSMPETDDPEALAAWRDAMVAHTALVAAYPSAQARWASDQAAYEAALAEWEAELETARQCVDRIAFCGQVPVNVTGDFAVGDYVIAVANGGGIKAVAIAEADITFDQYRRRIGKVWAVREGRAWVDVQHG